jgi:hypothetical protein
MLVDALHGELGLRDDSAASDTAFSVAGTARGPLDTLARQSTAFESSSDKETQDFGYAIGRPSR